MERTQQEHTQEQQEEQAQQAFEVEPGQENEEDPLKQIDHLTSEQESTLFAFLQKIQRACEGDSSLPDFIAPQVNEWLKELEVKTPEVTATEETHQQSAAEEVGGPQQ